MTSQTSAANVQMPSAPSDGGAKQVPDPATDIIYINLNTDGERNINARLIDLYAEAFNGVGNTEILKLEIYWTWTGEKQYLKYMIVGNDSSLSPDFFQGPGTTLYSGNMWTGNQERAEVPIGALFSRQLKPVSANAVEPKLCLKAHKDVQISICLHVRHVGPRMHYTTWSFRATA